MVSERCGSLKSAQPVVWFVPAEQGQYRAAVARSSDSTGSRAPFSDELAVQRACWRMRSRSFSAGSSVGSWGTRRPSNARFKMPCRSRAARLRLASTWAFTSSTMESRRSTSSTITACSSVGESDGDAVAVVLVKVCNGIVREDSVCFGYTAQGCFFF